MGDVEDGVQNSQKIFKKISFAALASGLAERERSLEMRKGGLEGNSAPDISSPKMATGQVAKWQLDK